MAAISILDAPIYVAKAIEKASKATGTAFDYLVRTAHRESNFKHNAKAKTSSAAGLFQFIEETWLQTVKEEGPSLGLKKYSDQISKSRSGKHYISNPKVRKKILAMRRNPEISALMAGAYTRKNAEYIEDRIGRTPSQAELYMAHFLGPGNATKLIELAASQPHTKAYRHFPNAALSNRHIFFSNSRWRTVGEVYKLLSERHGVNGAAIKRRDVTDGPWQVTVEASRRARSAGYATAGFRNNAGVPAQEGRIGTWRTIVSPSGRRDELGSSEIVDKRKKIQIHNLFQNEIVEARAQPDDSADKNKDKLKKGSFTKENTLGHLDLRRSLFTP